MALPGVSTVLKDRFYTLSRTDVPAGPRVLAIASRTTTYTGSGSVTVPDYDPFSPRSEQDVITQFGEGSGCHRAYLELVAGGSARVALVALPSGTADTSLYTASVFDAAFEAAETARPDIIVPWGRGSGPTDWENPATPSNDAVGFHADNTTSGSLTNNLAKLVADKCKDITDRSHPVFAVMGIKPYGVGTVSTESMTAAQVSTHLGLANLTNREATTFGENGQYLSVVATEMNVATYPQHATNTQIAGSFGYSNGAAMYAGYLSQLDAWSAGTGKQIFNVTGLRYNPTRTQQESLITKGVVPVALDFSRIPLWVDALTFSRSTSDYTRLSTLRIVFEAVLGVRQAAQSFVGEPANLHNRNALETAVTSVLRGMTQAGAINESDFVVTYVPRQNKAIIDLVLRPVFEMRNIEVSISVQL